MKVLKPMNLERFELNDRERTQSADAFAERAHEGQKRKSGEPYITHPRAVANYLLDLGVDADTVIAGLLHDVVEDTPVTIEEIRSTFGDSVANLVEGVTKLGQVEYVDNPEVSDRRHAVSVENIRKLLLAMSRDVRVLMIKLADRRHNLQTLKHLKPEDRVRIANESLEVFAPLADRLGMGVLKAEIEDLAFEYANPEAFKLVERLVASNVAETQDYIEELKGEVEKLLKQNNIEAVSIHGRQKHLYSVYRKLSKTEGDITKIYDLMALRVVVPNISDCYQVLGAIHQQYKPLIYRIKDYIAVPKPNGYRSLHTTVFAKHGKIIEIQIRTVEMHKEAENGLAAHSLYELQKNTKSYREGGVQASLPSPNKLAWIQELAGLTAQSEGSSELMNNLKVDLFRDRIFVFSPKGDLYDLPEGATPVDFAFAVHTDVGLRTQGAKVNGKIAPLDRALENRDVVEVITRKQASPNRQWLTYVKTAGARSKIKSWFRSASRETNIATGQQLIEAQLPTWGLRRLEDISEAQIKQAYQSLNYKDKESMLAALGEGALSLTTALRRLLPSKLDGAKKESKSSSAKRISTGRVQVIGAPELPCTKAQCCEPMPPDILVGYVTRGSGVTVHKASCGNIPDEPDRLLDCQWELISDRPMSAVLVEFSCYDRMGMVHDITGLILCRHINIVNISTKKDDSDTQSSIISVAMEIPDMYVLNGLIQQLKSQFGVKLITTQLLENKTNAR